jgi:hypothetical protein
LASAEQNQRHRQIQMQHKQPCADNDDDDFINSIDHKQKQKHHQQQQQQSSRSNHQRSHESSSTYPILHPSISSSSSQPVDYTDHQLSRAKSKSNKTKVTTRMNYNDELVNYGQLDDDDDDDNDESKFIHYDYNTEMIYHDGSCQCDAVKFQVSNSYWRSLFRFGSCPSLSLNSLSLCLLSFQCLIDTSPTKVEY